MKNASYTWPQLDADEENMDAGKAVPGVRFLASTSGAVQRTRAPREHAEDPGLQLHCASASVESRPAPSVHTIARVRDIALPTAHCPVPLEREIVYAICVDGDLGVGRIG